MENCPVCSGALTIEKTNHGLSLHFCASCNRAFTKAIIHRKIPGLDPGRASRKVRVREEAVEKAHIDACTRNNIELLITTVRFKLFPCPACKEWIRPAPQGYGATQGIPDTLNAPRWLPPYLLVGIELKGSETEIKPAQKRLADARRITISRGKHRVEEAWENSERVMRYLKKLLQPTIDAYYRDGRWPSLEEMEGEQSDGKP